MDSLASFTDMTMAVEQLDSSQLASRTSYEALAAMHRDDRFAARHARAKMKLERRERRAGRRDAPPLAMQGPHRNGTAAGMSASDDEIEGVRGISRVGWTESSDSDRPGQALRAAGFWLLG